MFENGHYQTQNLLTLFWQISSLDRSPSPIIFDADNLIGELEQEIAEYDRLKSGQITQFPIESLRDLPRVAIEARIAAGLTQKELAEKIGVHEQQIQRYEANNYHAVGFDRLQEVMSALDIKMGKTVTLPIKWRTCES